MNNSANLLEVVREIYENERGVGFLDSETHIVWRNPDPAPDLELGFQPLILSGPSKEEFDFVKAVVYLGWSGDMIGFDARSSIDDPYVRTFAEKMKGAYSQHDHQICIDAAGKLLVTREKHTALFSSRAALIDGKVIKI